MKKNEPLAKYTTLAIGGPAKLFTEVKTEEELIKSVRVANRLRIPFLIIGRGSNLLVSDKGFNGLAILNKVDGVSETDGKIYAKAGTQLSKLIRFAIDKGYQGTEKMAGIPGTVGGAVYGNAGAYGQAIGDHLTRVKVFEGQKVIRLTKADCRFGYRDSLFKKENSVLLEAEFKFKKRNKKELEKEAAKVIAERMKKYPAGILCPGSYFKNINASDLSQSQLKKIPEDKIIFGKIPAGCLLELVGAKGMTLGKIKVADYHGNLIINTGGGKASDFLKLTESLKVKVKEKFDIDLEPEVQLVGFKKKVAILGYGMEGQDAEAFFKKQGAEITILDQKFDKNYLRGLEGFDLIVRSPGVYRFLPEIVTAEKSGVKISSAIKLFFEECPAKIIGITGTKGKGTTATLIYQILKKAGKDVFLAGNIGKPYLELLSKLNKESFVVLELSSFQLIDLNISLHIAVVLNITLDHMDWHKSREEYVDAKKNIVRYQKKDDFAVINTDYQSSKIFAGETKAKVVYFSKSTLPGKFKRNLLLRGEHNLENIAAAVAIGKILKVSDEVIMSVLSSFKGLEHRLELVANVGGVSFYNDSFATGPQPTIAAIKSFSEPLTVILGGSEKWLDYTELGRVVARSKNLINAIIIGLVGPKIKKAITAAGFEGKIIDLGKNSIKEIVKKAFSMTPKGGVVLLSPAAASFDMFANYKDRGDQFKKAVQSLK